MLDTLNADTTLTTLQRGKNPLDDIDLADKDKETARIAAQDFEAFFLSQMVNLMMSGIGTDPVFGGGPGETMFRSLMGQEYGKSLAQNGGIGIADSVIREILQLQEQTQP